MAVDVSKYTTPIKTAVMAREVRDNIADGIDAIASEVNTYEEQLSTDNDQFKEDITKQESARVTAEATRVSAETTRQANETTRQTAEASRVTAETARETAFNGMAHVDANLELSAARQGKSSLLENLQAKDSQLADIAINIKNSGAVGNANYQKADGTWWQDSAFTIAATDDTNAFKTAISSTTKGKVFVPAGNYLITDNLLINKSGICLCGDDTGNSILKFKLPNNLTDGITLSAFNSSGTPEQGSIKNLTIDMSKTGRNGFVMNAGNRCILENIIVKNSYLDSFLFNPNGWGWIEGLYAHHLIAVSSGQHGYHLKIDTGSGAYMNECVFIQCQLRGCSFNANNGSAVYAETAAGTTTGNKVSSIHWVDCNFDSSRQNAINNGFDTNPHPMYLKYTSGGSNIFESWTVIGGGWEDNTNHNDTRAQGLIYGESGISAAGWLISGIINGGWSTGNTDNIAVNIQGIINNQAGSFIVTQNLIANNQRSMRFKQDLAASSTKDINLYFINPNVVDITNIQSYGIVSIDIELFHNRYMTNFNYYTKYQVECLLTKGAYESSTGILVLTPTVNNNSTNGAQFTINSITYNQTTEQLVINITTSSSWGASGGSTMLYGFIKTKILDN